jgi:hypothetical protein
MVLFARHHTSDCPTTVLTPVADEMVPGAGLASVFGDVPADVDSGF